MKKANTNLAPACSELRTGAGPGWHTPAGEQPPALYTQPHGQSLGPALTAGGKWLMCKESSSSQQGLPGWRQFASLRKS